MQSEFCTDCDTNTGTKKEEDNAKELILLMDNNFRCNHHALGYLDQREQILKNSTNLPTSITEQRLLDEVRVMKAKIK